jgi:uracil-DNA glycosylase
MRLDASGVGAWAALPFFSDGGLAAAESALARETRPVLPQANQVFRALELTQPGAVRAVILGQDPYPTPGHANGLAFSVAPGVAPPASLRNIFAELAEDLGPRPPRTNGDLTDWARQGVLLLNTVLTVPAGAANGHRRRIGWERLAAEVLAHLPRARTAFLLWGRPAQALGRRVLGAAPGIVEAAHPSPLSARRGFFGARPFSRANRWLEAVGQEEIRWA